MTNIKLKVKLGAYTKGIIPKLPSDLVRDVPNDGKEYVRKYDQWVELDLLRSGQMVKLAPDSGLNLIEVQSEDAFKVYELSIRQKTLRAKDLTLIEPDTTYYVIDDSPEYFVNGGTAYSGDDDIGDLIGQLIFGGSADPRFNLILLPINSKGVYNGN